MIFCASEDVFIKYLTLLVEKIEQTKSEMIISFNWQKDLPSHSKDGKIVEFSCKK